jgi:beta-fructofuranosidase
MQQRQETMTAETKRTERLVRCLQELKEKLERDPYRPAYHFLPPAGWLNDPNGALFWKGRYHLFYQYYPYAAHHLREFAKLRIEHFKLCWGHASSRDLVHWIHHPIALSPSAKGPDSGLCASGHAIDIDGVATIVYYGVPGGICMATCADDDLVRWQKTSQPVIPAPQKGDASYGRYGVGDPCIWQQDGCWYMLGGWRAPEGGDTASLFKSKDAVVWEFVHSFYTSDRKWSTVADDCACPDFSQLRDRHLLLFHSHETGVQYYLGNLQDETFYPESHGYMNWPGGQFNAPITMLDGQGRRLCWGWVCEARTQDSQRAAGWAGVLSLPRVLDLSADGNLLIDPAPELALLRYDHRRLSGIQLAGGSDYVLPEVQGDRLELALEVDPGTAKEVGVKVRCSPDNVEQTVIACRLVTDELVVDTQRSSLRADILQPWPRPWATLFSDPRKYLASTQHVAVQEAPFHLEAGEHLQLRVFLDRSVVEVFANRRQCVTQRIYPARADSLQVALFSTGGAARFISVEAWTMDPIGL